MSLIAPMCAAADAGNATSCKADLRNLILPHYSTKLDKSAIDVELGVQRFGLYYMVHLIKAGDTSVESEIGSLALFVGQGSNYAVNNFKLSKDGQPENLNLDPVQVKKFADKCLSGPANGKTETTALPLQSQNYALCAGASNSMNHCGERYHDYDIRYLPTDLAMQLHLPISMDNVMVLPPKGDLQVYLLSALHSDPNADQGFGVFVLAAFKNGKLALQEKLGEEIAPDKYQDFDISKDYLITLYERKEEKIKKVSFKRLDESGKLLVCDKRAEACH